MHWQDIWFPAAGFGICYLLAQDLTAAFGLWMFALIAYCAGRSVQEHR